MITPIDKITIDIVNVMASAKIREKVDVFDIASKIPCNYVPSRFAAAVVATRKKTGKTVHVNVYKQTVTSTGATTTNDAIEAILEVAGMITRKGIAIRFVKAPRIVNMTVLVYPSADAKIDQKVFAGGKKVPFFTTHKNVKHDRVNMMIAKSGKITVTGVQSLEQAISAAKKLFV